MRSPKGDGKYSLDASAKQGIENTVTPAKEVKAETLPITRLGNTWFDVDIEKRLFIKTGAPDHIISFDHMVYKGSHYEMALDLFTEKPPVPGSLNDEDVVMVKVPQLTQIAVAEMSGKYGIPATELIRMSDFEVMVNAMDLEGRKLGMLPTFEILDTKYKVDLDNGCFRSGNRMIGLNGFKADPDHVGQRYAYIDTHTHQIVKIDVLSLKEMPADNIVKIVIPSNDKLDPYHVGKNGKTDLRTYLMANPMVAGQKAAIVPLPQTNIPSIIKSNVNREMRQQFEQTQRLNARKARQGIS